MQYERIKNVIRYMITEDEIQALLDDLESDRIERAISTTNADKFGQEICAFANGFVSVTRGHISKYKFFGE